MSLLVRCESQIHACAMTGHVDEPDRPWWRHGFVYKKSSLQTEIVFTFIILNFINREIYRVNAHFTMAETTEGGRKLVCWGCLVQVFTHAACIVWAWFTVAAILLCVSAWVERRKWILNNPFVRFNTKLMKKIQAYHLSKLLTEKQTHSCSIHFAISIFYYLFAPFCSFCLYFVALSEKPSPRKLEFLPTAKGSARFFACLSLTKCFSRCWNKNVVLECKFLKKMFRFAKSMPKPHKRKTMLRCSFERICPLVQSYRDLGVYNECVLLPNDISDDFITKTKVNISVNLLF